MTDRAWKLIRGAGNIPDDTFESGFHYFVLANLYHRDSQHTEEFRKTVHQAETIFRKNPSLYWLGKTYLLKARYFVKKDHLERAAFCLENSFNIFSRLKARKELLNVIKEGSAMKISGNLLEKMTEKLPFKILLMVKGVLAEKDSEKMIARILSTALEFTEMERAVLILHGENPRIFKSTTLDHGTVNEICEISRSAMESTIPGKPLICLNASTDPSFKNRNSILANRIMSVVCLPLRVDNQLIGSLYLDSKEGVETLASTETVLLEIFAGIIALALNTSLVLEQSLEENEEFRASLGLKQDFPQIIGTSKPMGDVLKTVQRLMNSDIPVLITGETGTGKELIARVLHFCGHRRNGAFVAVNCSALTETLLESELFGHEKGSFTGATGMRKGLFEEAKNGTLFLDEIGDMMHSMQAKFLRVLQDGEFRRVGGNETFRTNARIVLATNRNLYELIGEKKFREDLYYRIHGARIHLPSLRERTEDIPLLASFFLKASMAVAKKKIHGFTPDALDLMKRYSWPGNVRQLKSEIERIVTLTDHDWIDLNDFDPQLHSNPEDSDRLETLRELEKEWIVDRLKRHDWNILHTARSLGLTRNGLYSKMKMYSIPRKPPASELLM
jgi:Nif-specific regulatory protein